MKLLYLLELAYYTQELPMLFVWFTKRKDFGQMVAHHIATLGLVVYSLELGCVCSKIVARQWAYCCKAVGLAQLFDLHQVHCVCMSTALCEATSCRQHCPHRLAINNVHSSENKFVSNNPVHQQPILVVSTYPQLLSTG